MQISLNSEMYFNHMILYSFMKNADILFFRPLHEACENGFVEVTRLLLAYGADPTLMTYSGLTPLALTNDETTKHFLKNYLNEIDGELSAPWITCGPASFFGNFIIH